MAHALTILHLEDSENDRFFIARSLQQGGIRCDIVYAKNREEYLVALTQKPVEIILADYSLPGFDGLTALGIARQKKPGIPFIFVTGSMGEQNAVDAIKQGATDYIIKDRAARLAAAVTRALNESNERSERIAAEKRLEKQANLLDKASDAIIVTDLQDRIVFWNKGAERLYGWASTEALDHKSFELLAKNKSSRLEEAHRQTIDKAEWVGELLYFSKAGKVVVTHSHWTLVRNEAGQPESVLSVNADITEHKQLEAQYLRAQRMESIGILAGGIAHDLNNVLSPILMVSQLLRMQNPPPQSLELLDTLETSAKHGADLIRQILSFARGVEGQHVEIQIGHLVRELQKILKETLPRSIQLEINVPRELWTIKGVPTHVNQVLMNLIVNARDALPGGGKISVTAENVMVDEAYSRLHADAKPGPYVAVVVTDTGGGIPPELLKNIYDPFFTTKEIGKGTGLGLSTVKSIVKNHGGFVHVYSELGKGASFRIYFPAAFSARNGETIQEQQPSLPRGNGECILVVDDEQAILKTTKTILQRYGYEVISASDGAEGIATFVKHRDSVKVVLTDIMMPVLDGVAMIQTLLKLAPKLRVIALSGMIESHKAAELKALGDIELLQKPYSLDRLLSAVKQALARNA